MDATITTDLTENTVFSDSSRTLAFLTDIYANIGFSVNVTRFGNGGLDAACDESEPHSSANISTSTLFATGTINAAIVSGD
ncbi:MAG TPA: RagB/SusD family nutrient uptake outer membrane protein, partial [Bacteroidales bacterium]